MNYKNIIKHYEECLNKYGDTHLGVDWPKKEDVDVRYNIMLGLIKMRQKLTSSATLLDFGCGAAHLYDYMQRMNLNNISYSGLDISRKFIDLSKKKHPGNKFYCLDILKNQKSLPSFDYIIMNGVFTEKVDLNFDQMFGYLKEMLKVVFEKANIGVAFNVMSTAVEWEREDLFHLSKDQLVNFLIKDLTRNFVIRNDYGLYEYTIYIYKEKCQKL